MEYSTIFSKRAATYIYALKTYPAVLANEFHTAVDKCRLRDKDILLLIPCSCEHIQPYLPSGVTCIEYETNKELAAATNKPYCQFHDVPLPNASATHILTLATLHHLTTEERLNYYTEAKRILQAGGRFVIGDVIKDSPQDHWLNTFVNTYNSYGHKGTFFTESDTSLLEQAGFKVEIEYATYTWDFQSQEEMTVLIYFVCTPTL